MNAYENLKKWNNLPYSKATLEVIFDKLLPVLWQDFDAGDVSHDFWELGSFDGFRVLQSFNVRYGSHFTKVIKSLHEAALIRELIEQGGIDPQIGVWFTHDVLVNIVYVYYAQNGVMELEGRQAQIIELIETIYQKIKP